MINILYTYLMLGLLVSAVEAVLTVLYVLYVLRTPSRRVIYTAMLIYMLLAVVAWPYILFIEFCGDKG